LMARTKGRPMSDDVQWEQASARWTGLINNLCKISESIRKLGGVKFLASRWSRRQTEGYVRAFERWIAEFQSIHAELEAMRRPEEEGGSK
jgi:hypothetical protein